MSTNQIAVIYLLTNTVNGKRYVGFTTNLKSTLNRHKTRAGKRDFHLSRAIAKHGWGSFVCEVLASSRDVAYMKDVMEGHFIKLYDTFHTRGNGYNMTWGGEGTMGYQRTPAQRQRLSQSFTGREVTPEQRRRISERTRGERNPNYGKKHSPETRAKISARVKANWRGGTWTPERRKRQSERMKVQANLPENIERTRRLGQSGRGKPGHVHTEEHKRHMSQVMTGKPVTEATRRRLTFVNMDYLWTITGPEGKVYQTGCLQRFCEHFGVNTKTIEKTLDPTWSSYRKRRCPWTGLSKRLITPEERQRFETMDQFWEGLPYEPVHSHPLGEHGLSPSA